MEFLAKDPFRLRLAAANSLPLNGSRRLGGHVVDDAVDAAHLVDDAVGGAQNGGNPGFFVAETPS